MDGWAYWVDCGVRSSVRKKPGSTSMVRMPNGATSGARASMNPSTPNLEAAYAVVNWTGEVMPAVEEIVLTKPELKVPPAVVGELGMSIPELMDLHRVLTRVIAATQPGGS